MQPCSYLCKHKPLSLFVHSNWQILGSCCLNLAWVTVCVTSILMFEVIPFFSRVSWVLGLAYKQDMDTGAVRERERSVFHQNGDTQDQTKWEPDQNVLGLRLLRSLDWHYNLLKKRRRDVVMRRCKTLRSFKYQRRSCDLLTGLYDGPLSARLLWKFS